MNVLVIDVGGSHVKLLATDQPEPRRFDSGPTLTPDKMVDEVRRRTDDWPHDVVALGYPGTVGHDGPTEEPGNLGDGWVAHDFVAAFGKPVRVVNDAVMQALGAYPDDGRRMLFLGLGTGLGSALVADRVAVPLELGTLPFPQCGGGGGGNGSSSGGRTMADRLGKRGLARHGRGPWLRAVRHAVGTLRRALAADYVVLGGGNADLVDPLPPHARRGGNEDAFTGGFRLWEERVEHHDERRPSDVWRVVR